MAEGHPVPSHGFVPRDGRSPARLPVRSRGPARLPARGPVRSRGLAHAEGGAVTAEFAVALPTVLLVLAVLLSTATVALHQMRCIDAARAAARAAARNDPAADVVAIAHAVGPPGAEVTVASQGGRVVVTVSAPVTLRLPGSPTLWVSSRAVALREVGGELTGGAGVVTAAAGQSAGVAGRRRRRFGFRSVGLRRRGSEHRRRLGTGSACRSPSPGPRHVGGCSHRPAVNGLGLVRCGGGDRGAGTVLAIGLVGVVIGLTAVLTALGLVISAQHQAAAAADLAALAAAQAAAGTSAAMGAGPCDVAARVASANSGRLASCSLDPAGSATVVVLVSTWRGLTAEATSRAGPAYVGG